MWHDLNRSSFGDRGRAARKRDRLFFTFHNPGHYYCQWRIPMDEAKIKQKAEEMSNLSMENFGFKTGVCLVKFCDLRIVSGNTINAIPWNNPEFTEFLLLIKEIYIAESSKSMDAPEGTNIIVEHFIQWQREGPEISFKILISYGGKRNLEIPFSSKPNFWTLLLSQQQL